MIKWRFYGDSIYGTESSMTGSLVWVLDMEFDDQYCRYVTHWDDHERQTHHPRIRLPLNWEPM